MPLLILDPLEVKRYEQQQAAARGGEDRFTEVWDGTTVMPPIANNEHQALVMRLAVPISEVVDWDAGDQALPGANVSDRATDWTYNFRGPDVVVYLNGNPAVNHGTFWEGGPDFLVEIISPGEKPDAKFDFYAKVNTREVLVVERDPWAVELFQLRRKKLRSAGRSDLAAPAVLTSSVLPMTFRLLAGTPRPKVEVVHPPTGRRWEA